MSGIRGFEFKPENLIGTSDPYSLVTLRAGERIVACTRCQVGYQLDTMRFLQQASMHHCLSCTQADKLMTIVLPQPAVAVAPVVKPTPTVATPPPKSQPVVRLEAIRQHVGQIVDFQGYVHEVYRAVGSGTVFVKFEKTKSPVEGFRLVIFNSYLDAWRQAGIDWEAYAGHEVMVHGVIRDDPQWGIQMLIDRPELIKVVDGGAHPAQLSAPPSQPHPQPTPVAPARSSGRISWTDRSPGERGAR